MANGWQRIPTWLLALIVPVVALVAVLITRPDWSTDTRAASSASPAVATSGEAVTIKDFAFAPTPLSIPTGTKLVVTNADGAAHTLTADDGTFDTGPLQSKKKAAVVAPAAPGEYRYHCAIHVSMKGTLEVKE